MRESLDVPALVSCQRKKKRICTENGDKVAAIVTSSLSGFPLEACSDFLRKFSSSSIDFKTF